MRPRSLLIRVAAFCLPLAVASRAFADGPDDNLAEHVRPVPPPGIEISSESRASLEKGLAELDEKLQRLAQLEDPFVREYLPDAQVFVSAVRMSLTLNTFYDEKDVARALELLAEGRLRAGELERGLATWNEATGLVVRGYVSRIDGSVQPYGLVVPDNYTAQGSSPHRLDLWFHGRGEKLSEVNFLAERSRNAGEFTPRGAFVLHPYGRYCNANKFAGEIDTFEALADVKRHYRIDDDRVVARGFSMGGAACWQFAVHYADQWCAAAPGAGFAETPEFLRVFQHEDVQGVPDYERKLWHWYDCTDYARNLFQCPTIAYSGELDVQRQAAEIMATAMAKEGLPLRHVIGPDTQHSYHPAAKETIEAALAEIASRGRERFPRELHFETYTLRYNRMCWLTVEGLDEHWARARVDAVIDRSDRVVLTTENVNELTLSFPSGACPISLGAPVTVIIDGGVIACPAPLSDRSWECRLHRPGGKDTWTLGPRPDAEALRKRPGLQGPIDDAFLDAFLFVRPTAEFGSPPVKEWTLQEMTHAVDAWRKQFRGEAPIKNDVDVTDEDIATKNLVLWGDVQSNRVLQRIAAQLPIHTESGNYTVDGHDYSASNHALLLIAPNPLNPRRYVVLNSGPTFREYDYLNNARQVAKLPDWAIVDILTPANSRYPGRVEAAGFFDELWRLPAK